MPNGVAHLAQWGTQVCQVCHSIEGRGPERKKWHTCATRRFSVEEMLSHGQQVVWLDPLDVAWGLRSSRDGRSEGFRVIVIGGEHGGLPLEATAGAVVAEFVVSTGASVILSLRHLSMADQRRVATDFCEKLFHLKGRDGNRTPLHLVLDECDEFVPQRIQHGYERLFGAVDRLVRRGRSSGIGVALISQRPAVVNKDVLSQCETLICHRTISPQDRKALEAWISAHDVHGQREAFLSSLASLERGEAWFWSPGWLDVFAKIKIRAPHTFDSSSTPKAGAAAAAPKAIAAVDLDQLRGQMADTIERAKADDPRELRKRIAELERAAAAKPSPAEIAEHYNRGYRDGANKITRLILETLTPSALAGAVPPAPVSSRVALAAAAPRHAAPTTANSEIGTGGLRRILVALAQRSPLTRRQLGVRAQLSSRSGTFDTYLSKARQNGWIEGRDALSITDIGRAALGSYEPLPHGRALLDYWMGQVPDGTRRILAALARAYPQALSRAQLGAGAGLSDRSGTFDTYLSRLRTLELIEGKGEIRLSEELA
jgi:hypothetical protein